MFAIPNIFFLKVNIYYEKKEYPTIKSNMAILNKYKDEIVNIQKEAGIIDTHTTVIIRSNKLKERENFVKVFQKGFRYATTSLSPSGCKLFMFFMSEIKYGNYLEIDQKDIQNELNIGRTSVNKGLKELLELNVIKIIDDKNDRRRHTYKINHHVMWKGNPSDRIVSIKNMTKKGSDFVNPYQLMLELPQEKK